MVTLIGSQFLILWKESEHLFFHPFSEAKLIEIKEGKEFSLHSMYTSSHCSEKSPGTKRVLPRIGTNTQMYICGWGDRIKWPCWATSSYNPIRGACAWEQRLHGETVDCGSTWWWLYKTLGDLTQYYVVFSVLVDSMISF